MNRKLTGGLENLTIGYEQPYMDNGSLEYTKEGLHMSDKGYEVITKELKKYMHK